MRSTTLVAVLVAFASTAALAAPVSAQTARRGGGLSSLLARDVTEALDARATGPEWCVSIIRARETVTVSDTSNLQAQLKRGEAHEPAADAASHTAARSWSCSARAAAWWKPDRTNICCGLAGTSQAARPPSDSGNAAVAGAHAGRNPA